MKTKGIRMTDQRKIIMEILENTNDHLSAEEIYIRAKDRQKRINFSTVYRNLNMMEEKGLVIKLDFNDGKSRYELKERHHHHIICVNCRKTYQLPTCPLDNLEEKLTRESGYKISAHKLEVYGYCPDCQ
jgi:Fur family ferric uptake transcriptional regulator